MSSSSHSQSHPHPSAGSTHPPQYQPQNAPGPPIPADPRRTELASKVVSILATTADACFAENGLRTTMPQELANLDATCRKLRSDNIILDQQCKMALNHIQALTNEVVQLKEKLGRTQLARDDFAHLAETNVRNVVSGLRAQCETLAEKYRLAYEEVIFRQAHAGNTQLPPTELPHPSQLYPAFHSQNTVYHLLPANLRAAATTPQGTAPGSARRSSYPTPGQGQLQVAPPLPQQHQQQQQQPVHPSSALPRHNQHHQQPQGPPNAPGRVPVNQPSQNAQPLYVPNPNYPPGGHWPVQVQGMRPGPLPPNPAPGVPLPSPQNDRPDALYVRVTQPGGMFMIPSGVGSPIVQSPHPASAPPQLGPPTGLPPPRPQSRPQANYPPRPYATQSAPGSPKSPSLLKGAPPLGGRPQGQSSSPAPQDIQRYVGQTMQQFVQQQQQQQIGHRYTQSTGSISSPPIPNNARKRTLDSPVDPQKRQRVDAPGPSSLSMFSSPNVVMNPLVTSAGGQPAPPPMASLVPAVTIDLTQSPEMGTVQTSGGQPMQHPTPSGPSQHPVSSPAQHLSSPPLVQTSSPQIPQVQRQAQHPQAQSQTQNVVYQPQPQHQTQQQLQQQSQPRAQPQPQPQPQPPPQPQSQAPTGQHQGPPPPISPAVNSGSASMFVLGPRASQPPVPPPAQALVAVPRPSGPSSSPQKFIPNAHPSSAPVSPHVQSDLSSPVPGGTTSTGAMDTPTTTTTTTTTTIDAPSQSQSTSTLQQPDLRGSPVSLDVKMDEIERPQSGASSGYASGMDVPPPTSPTPPAGTADATTGGSGNGQDGEEEEEEEEDEDWGPDGLRTVAFCLSYVLGEVEGNAGRRCLLCVERVKHGYTAEEVFPPGTPDDVIVQHYVGEHESVWNKLRSGP